MSRRLATGLALAAALALPSAAAGATTRVTMQSGAFAPIEVTVLAGDTVEWSNASLTGHTVTARDGSFDSGRVGPRGSYSRQFPTSGFFAYYCQIHPLMTGQVDVYPVLLEGPKDAVARGGYFTLHGRAEPGTSSVRIQRNAGGGYGDVASVPVDAAGNFQLTLPALESADYRAVDAAGASPMAKVVVADRKLVVAATRRHRKALVRVRAVPRDPGGTVVLQVRLRERFGWWPVAKRRLDRHSRAAFRAPLGKRIRVVLTLRDGWTPLARSATVRVPRRHARHKHHRHRQHGRHYR